jgi:F-type H+-transporting ATPase subunit epsilon
MAEGVLHVLLVSPERAVFEDDAAALVVPAWDGMVGILPRHAPMLALLGTGELSVDLPGGGSRSFYVSGGVLKVENDQVTVLTEHASTEKPPGARHAEAQPGPEAIASAGNPLD